MTLATDDNPPAVRAEVAAALFTLQQAFEALIVRGLSATGTDDLRQIAALGDELARAGAAYLASRIATLVHAAREHDDSAARALLGAQTAARVFERVLSLDAAAEALTEASGQAAGQASHEASGEPAGGETGPPRAAAPPAGLAPDPALVPVLDELAGLIEALVDSGLTAATRATLDKLGATGKEASRLKLLRLATALRYVADECGRFLADSEQFSARRLAFFANRTWLLARGISDAIARADRAALARLLLAAEQRPVAALTVAVLGVHKRALLDGSAAFEFRMRTLREAGGVPRGARLVWSCVFGARKNVPAEAFLHLPQPQKFLPRILLEPTEIVISDAMVSLDDTGAGRVTLGPRSKVVPGPTFTRWDELATWPASDIARAAQRIRNHRISPLDLEVELHEDIVVTDYELGARAPSPFRVEQEVYPLRAGGLVFDAVVSTGRDGVALARALDELFTSAGAAPGSAQGQSPHAKAPSAGAAPSARKHSSRAKAPSGGGAAGSGVETASSALPPLYGVMHYEMARLVFQPLTALTPEGPRHLMISRDSIDLAALMKTLDFTT